MLYSDRKTTNTVHALRIRSESPPLDLRGTINTTDRLFKNNIGTRTKKSVGLWVASGRHFIPRDVGCRGSADSSFAPLFWGVENLYPTPSHLTSQLALSVFLFFLRGGVSELQYLQQKY